MFLKSPANTKNEDNKGALFVQKVLFFDPRIIEGNPRILSFWDKKESADNQNCE